MTHLNRINDLAEAFDLINAERNRQDFLPGNSNGHNDYVWTGLIVKQLGQAIEAGQSYLSATTDHDCDIIMGERKKQVVQAAALCVAWLEDIVAHERL